MEIAKIAGINSSYAFICFLNDPIAGMLEKNPSKFFESFKRIAAAGSNRAHYYFLVLSGEKMAANFVKEPSKTLDAFDQIANAVGDKVGAAFIGLAGDKTAEYFNSWLEGKASKEKFFTRLFSTDEIATEIGRPLDDLHNEDLRDPKNKRTEYLNSLSKETVLALLCSNPEYFYTSSNNLLFDRLIKLSKGKGINETLREYGLEGTEQHRNLLFRAINYGRFYGGHDPVFAKEDAEKSIGTLLSPLKEKYGFDKTYFYLLANCLGGLTPAMKEATKVELTKCKIHAFPQTDFPGAKERYAASSYIIDYLNNPKEKEVSFNPSKYRGKDGKLLVVQVFSKQDTENDHWALSQQWFAKYGKPKIGENGEFIFETKNARIILYMGEDEDSNQNFVKNLFSKSTNLILTFRGHSFSLKGNMPPKIFGNYNCNVLFIPGSCGSAGSTPDYLANNPKTDMDFVSNTSTGRGQVTNALLDIFISEDARVRSGGELRTYKAILNDKANAEKITANGGNPATLKASSLGEEMLERVYKGK